MVKSSVADPDPDPDPWIRPFLAGSGSAELRIQMRIQWSDNFNGFLAKFWVIYFFEVWKSVQWFKSYDFFHWIQIFGQKIVIFCKLEGWNWPKKIDFLTKSTQLWRLITFEPLDGFSNFKKVKHSKFRALSIGSGSGSAKTSWIRIRIRLKKSGSTTLKLRHFSISINIIFLKII